MSTKLEAASRPAPVEGKAHLFLTMDGLRGVAALAVIAFHGSALFGRLQFPSGYLAVDFFFMLSGFVLTYAYQAKLDAGWSTWAYFKTRVVRLYPLYLVGLVLGLVYLTGLRVERHEGLVDGGLLRQFGLGLLILPETSTHPFTGVTAFPLNYPSWSIFFELVVNIGQALFLRRCSTRVLAGVAAVSLAAMVGYTRVTGTINVGLDSPENLFCLFRVAFAYAVGMMLFRIWRSGRFRVTIPPGVIAMVLLVVLALPLAHARVVQELAVVVLVFPVLILLAAKVEPGPRWRPTFRMLGQTSYAVYILHAPLLSVTGQVLTRVRHASPEIDAPWNGLGFVAVLLGLAVVVDRVYDVPARTWLRNRLLPRRMA